MGNDDQSNDRCLLWIDTTGKTVDLATTQPIGSGVATKRPHGLIVGGTAYVLASYGVWVWDTTNSLYIPYSS